MAYSGRAAAYEKTGDFDRAVADFNMLVFSYAIELDADDPKGDGYNDLLREAVPLAVSRDRYSRRPARQVDVSDTEVTRAETAAVRGAR